MPLHRKNSARFYPICGEWDGTLFRLSRMSIEMQRVSSLGVAEVNSVGHAGDRGVMAGEAGLAVEELQTGSAAHPRALQAVKAGCLHPEWPAQKPRIRNAAASAAASLAYMLCL